jgi:hypothetical protein
MYAYKQGLDLIELRAVYAAFPTQFENDPTDEKRQFRDDIRSKLVMMVDHQQQGKLRLQDQRHEAYMVDATAATTAVAETTATAETASTAESPQGESQRGQGESATASARSLVALEPVFGADVIGADVIGGDVTPIGDDEAAVKGVVNDEENNIATESLVAMIGAAAMAYSEKRKQAREKQLKRHNSVGSESGRRGRLGGGNGANPLANALAMSFAKRGPAASSPALNLGK